MHIATSPNSCQKRSRPAVTCAKADALLTQPFDAVIYHGDSDQLRELYRAGGGPQRRDCLGAGLRPRGPACRWSACTLGARSASTPQREESGTRQPDDNRLINHKLSPVTLRAGLQNSPGRISTAYRLFYGGDDERVFLAGAALLMSASALADECDNATAA